ncbi:MAG: hypothetical protein NTY18_08000, partial [Deltaproteobacteria bacterium]|nr:hypothetical protein [Deltaproteobacteria bacterium]
LRLAATAPANTIDVADLPDEVQAAVTAALGPPLPPPAAIVPIPPSRLSPALDPDREGLLRALQASRGNVARAAASLRISRMTLYRWIHRHGIARCEYPHRA